MYSSMLQTAIKEYGRHTKAYREYVNVLKEISEKNWPGKLEELAERRKMPVEVFRKAETFYIGNMAAMVVPEFMGMLTEFGVINSTSNTPIFENRWIFPIKDSNKNIINLVGYTWNHDVRYLYGTGKYYERSNDMYGAENIDLIYKTGWGVLVEGITDCLALRSIGVENSLASCGTTDSPVKMQILGRTKYGMVFIHDRDEAGDGTRKHWIVPRAVRLDIASGQKDIDEYLHKYEDDADRQSREEELLLRLDECESWLKGGLCKGDKQHSIIKNMTLV